MAESTRLQGTIKDHPSTKRRWHRRPATFVVAGLLLAATAVVGAIILTQDATVTSTSRVSDVVFQDGGGGLAGFATMSVPGDGATASITLTPVSGATMQVTDMVQISNTHATQAYTVSLGRSAAPDADITAMTFTVFNDVGTQVDQYDAVADTGGGFTLPALKAYDIRIDMTVADGQGTNSLGAFDLEFTLTAV